MKQLLPPLFVVFGIACNGRGVDNDRDAALAWLGLEGALDKALNLGLDGYNAASSANIDPQQAEGDLSGTLTISGQVDQGSSDNKGMRLSMALQGYADETTLEDEPFVITYDTDAGNPPALDMSLKDMPDGTLTATLLGEMEMSSDIEGLVYLDLSIASATESGDDGVAIQRVAGSTTVTGTAESSYGVYEVDLTGPS